MLYRLSYCGVPGMGAAGTSPPLPGSIQGGDFMDLSPAEVNAWAAAQARAMEQSGTLSLLASPGHWSAPETLADVQRRLIRPATLLAQTLLDGQPAPRTLTWRPSSPAPTLPMLAGAAPRPLLRTSQRVAA